MDGAKEAVVIEVEGFHDHGYCKCGPAKIYYALFGRGPVKVVLLMGIATSGYAWKNQIEYLVQFPQYQICIIDNRGSGKTETPVGRLTTSLMAQDVIQVLDHLGWANVHIVGNSLGGMIAQELVIAIPNKTLSLTLIATHCGGWKAYIPPWQAFLTLLRHPFVKTQKDQTRVLMEIVFSEKFLALPGKKENFSVINGEYSTILDYYYDSLIYQIDGIFVKKNPMYMFLQQMTAVLTHSVSTTRLGMLRNKFPILLVVGTGDKVVHPSHTDRLHSILGGELIKFEGAGHAVTEECLDEVNAALHKHFCKVAYI